MSRLLRIEYPGALYHVMNRGVARQNIFNSEDHNFYFLELLEETHRRFQIEIHAYCLMSNHYHLLVRSVVNNLSDAIRYLNGMYSKSFNKSMKRDGPLFKGRYKAILVDTDSYFIQVSRYIHCNPVAANIAEAPEHYKWSSYQYYLDPDVKPHWLFCNATLAFFNNKISSYSAYVSEGVDEKTKMFFQSSTLVPIFGSKEFVSKIAKEIKPDNEVLGSIRLFEKTRLSISEIVKFAAKEYDLSEEELTQPHTKRHRNLRNYVIYVCARSAKKRHQAISEFFKCISRSGVSQVCHRLDTKIKLNDQIANEINKINTTLLKETQG